MIKRISLKYMLAEGFYYDVGTEKNTFESEVASATEQAKKKFEDSMKQKVLNQKVKVRASRGQPGQPEKDYVLDKVSSASVDWYWKQYVVVLKDEKGKEYFLKPGFKVEVLSQPAAGKPTQQIPKEPSKPSPSPVAPGSKSQSKPATGAPVAPQSAPTAPTAPTGQPKAKAPVAESGVTEGKKGWIVNLNSESGDHYGPFSFKKEPTPEDIKKLILTKTPEEINIDGPGEFGSYVYADISSPEEIGEARVEDGKCPHCKRPLTLAVGGSQRYACSTCGTPIDDADVEKSRKPDVDPKVKDVMGEEQQEYKKEWVADAVSEIIFPFLSPEIQEKIHRYPNPHIIKYVKSATWGDDSASPDSPRNVQWVLEIPQEDLDPNLDVREMNLAFRDGLRTYEGPGQSFTRGSADIQKMGRVYRIIVDYSVGLDI